MNRRSVLARYGLAVTTPFLVATTKFFIGPITGDESPFLLFVLAVMLSAWYGGFGASVVAAVLTAAASDLLFLTPGTLVVGNTIPDNFRLGLFVFEALLIGRMVSSFVAAREALREANDRKDDFIAVLAHELRNCLAPLKLAGQLLSRGLQDEAAVSLARNSVEHQVAHMSRLIDDLLESSRALRAKVSLKKEIVDVTSILKEAAGSCSSLLTEQRQELILSVPSGPLWVEADPTRLMQILMNLLANASKYSGEQTCINLDAEPRDGEVQIRIRDQGMGISSEMLPHIFEPFTQARPTSEATGGLGVGLALVRKLVKLHEGEISAHSAGTGQGSEFVIRLPRVVKPLQLHP